MVRVDFDRPGLDSAWTPEHKCAGVSPLDSVRCAPYQQHLSLSECQATASDDVRDDDALPSPPQMTEMQEPSEYSQSGITVFEEQSPVPTIEDAVGQEQDFEKCDVAVETDQELQEEAHDMTLVESNPDQVIEPCKAEDQTKECKAQKLAPKGCRGLPCLNSLWEGLTGLWKPGAKRPQSDKAVTGTDSDLQLALLESASFHAKEVSRIEARERLQRVMILHHAQPKPVQADGNCQFRALSQQLYGDESYHDALRAKVVERLEAAPECYADFVHEPYMNYIKRMARCGEWGDNVTLQAASDALGTDIHILTDVEGAECVKVHPTRRDSESYQKPLCLTFLTELHYDAAELP